MVGISVRTGSYSGTWDCAPGAAADAADASWDDVAPRDELVERRLDVAVERKVVVTC